MKYFYNLDKNKIQVGNFNINLFMKLFFININIFLIYL